MLTAALLAVHVIGNEMEGFGKWWVNQLSQTIQPGSFPAASPFSGIASTGTMLCGKKLKPWPWEERRGAVLNFLQLEFPVPVGADVRRLIKYCQTVNFSDIQREPSARTTTGWDGLNISPDGCAGRVPLGGRYFRRAGHCRKPVAIPRASPDYPRFSKAAVRCSRG
jgi:hypothetical protein